MKQPAATAAPSSTGPTTRNWLLRVAYDGAAYAGWQIQLDRPTVQGVLTQALQDLLNTDAVEVQGCSRTDAGVHALAQMVTVLPPPQPPIPPAAVRRALRSRLPADIRVLACTEQEPGFRIRHAVAGKAYTYVFHRGVCDCPFWGRYCWSVPQELDAAAMEQAAARLLGRHDFSGFSVSSRNQAPVQPHCELFAVHLRQAGSLILLTVIGDRFLYRMVRRLAGFLAAVGCGRLAPPAVDALLAGTADGVAFDTAPPQALFLEEVFIEAVDRSYRPAELPFLKLLA